MQQESNAICSRDRIKNECFDDSISTIEAEAGKTGLQYTLSEHDFPEFFHPQYR
jgi:hypothetical protein